MTPARIQLCRRKGWRLQTASRDLNGLSAVDVARPSKWGNPFRVFGKNEYLYSDASHRREILYQYIIFDLDQDIEANRATPAMAVEHYRRWVLGEFKDNPNVRPCPFTVEDIRRELGGKNLACWCKLGTPCHADVLLEMANG